MKKLNNKCKVMIDMQLQVIDRKGCTINALRSALYTSSKGTKHFYEALQLLSITLPNEYLQEFEDLKAKHDANC